jgi:hypothetical protein
MKSKLGMAAAFALLGLSPAGAYTLAIYDINFGSPGALVTGTMTTKC